MYNQLHQGRIFAMAECVLHGWCVMSLQGPLPLTSLTDAQIQRLADLALQDSGLPAAAVRSIMSESLARKKRSAASPAVVIADDDERREPSLSLLGPDHDPV